jgi:hypothetical protein
MQGCDPRALQAWAAQLVAALEHPETRSRWPVPRYCRWKAVTQSGHPSNSSYHRCSVYGVPLSFRCITVWVEEDVRHHTTCPLQNKHLVAAVWSKDLEQNLSWQGPRHVAHGDTKNTSHGSHWAQSIWGKIWSSRTEGSNNQFVTV